MLPTRREAIRLFRLAGIDVFLHWTWFLIVAYSVSKRAERYTSLVWPVLEYLALFGIVLTHEFGHALACRSVGGTANQIVLWPLGGVAYVAPPQRPGAILWSIAAGPLVNVVLAPLLGLLWYLAASAGWADSLPNAYTFIRTICVINLALLVFNLLPIFPLDGGQILRSLLWFVLGRARSLFVATIIGFIGVAGLITVAIILHGAWLGVLSVFILLNCWGGLQQARRLARMDRMPRRPGYICPVCKEPPIVGPVWLCDHCKNSFDTFESNATCPRCGAQFPEARCPYCGRWSPLSQWLIPPPLPKAA